jgi:transposase InsO family protein
MQTYLVGLPFERISADILGPLPVTARRNKYILVIGDHFTKWIEANPLPNQEAETIAKKIVSEFVCRYGAFRQFHTDKGANFESGIVKGVCDVLGIQKTSTTPYHPQSDGMIERQNRTLNSSLAMMIKKNQKDWDLQLPFAMFAYRTAFHETTKHTPYQMCFGREATLPIDVMFGSPNETETEASDFVSTLRVNLESAFHDARKSIMAQHQRQKRLYDQRSHGEPYRVRDFVWLYNPKRKKGIATKLSCHWSGPYMITKRISDIIYRIQTNRMSKPKIVHYDRLKRYKGVNAKPWTIENPQINNERLQNEENGTENTETNDARPSRERKPPNRLIESN